jgi:hypothetical protein
LLGLISRLLDARIANGPTEVLSSLKPIIGYCGSLLFNDSSSAIWAEVHTIREPGDENQKQYSSIISIGKAI